MRFASFAFAVFSVASVACVPAARGPDAPKKETDASTIRLQWSDLPAPESSAARSPVSLTASDGTGLALETLHARAVVEGPLAFTELRFVFANPRSRRIEGRFTIGLPEGASVSRFAMRIGDELQEGEVVEKRRATRAYEDFLHRSIDPALLDREAGNRFGARVFPIEPLEKKEIVVSYSHELRHADEAYRLPLAGLPTLKGLRVDVIASGKRFELEQTSITPDRDFVMSPERFAREGAPRASSVRAGAYAVARISPSVRGTPEPISGLVILLDTSASRADALRADAKRVTQLVAKLAKGDADTKVRVSCFDQSVEPIYDGPASRYGSREEARIIERGAAGASNLERALRHVRGRKGTPRRVLVVSDGVFTAGAAAERGLVRAVTDLRGAKTERLDFVLTGQRRSAVLAKRLVTAGLRKHGVVIDDASPSEVVKRLGASASTTVDVRVPGSQWAWPERLVGVQPGDEVLVFARLPEGTPFRVELHGPSKTSIDIESSAAPEPLVERAAMRARIEALTSQRAGMASDDKRRVALRERIVDLSTRYRVLSDFTSLLVLESEQDYRTYRIDRNALRDVLTVGPRGLRLLHREDWVAPVAPPPSNRRDWDTRRDTEPPSDRDGDNIPDRDDQCPDQPETYNDLKDEDGCPDRAMVLITSSELRILQQVHFKKGSTTIQPESMPILRAVAEVMTRHRWILLVEISGHTDSNGSKAVNLRMSEARAKAVRAKLIELGVEPERLRAKGYGESQPLVPNNSERNRALNRRTGFRILEQGKRGVLPPARRSFRRPRRDRFHRMPVKHGQRVAAHEGPFAAVQARLAKGDAAGALERARAFTSRNPRDVLALIALGEAYEALDRPGEAARAYGSIIDLHPSRAELRRLAGNRLERVAFGGVSAPAARKLALELALDTYRKAYEQRPDQPSGLRLLAFALARTGKLDEAFRLVTEALRQQKRFSRSPNALGTLSSDAALLGQALIKASPDREDDIKNQLQLARVVLDTRPSLTFVLTWETDVSDVDLHVVSKNEKTPRPLPCFSYGQADVTNGFGPECYYFPTSEVGYPIELGAHLYAKGPQGVAMGKVQIIEHDGQGTLRFDDRPFVIMPQGGYASLGTVAGPLGG